jgi:hypothetical protein
MALLQFGECKRTLVGFSGLEYNISMFDNISGRRFGRLIANVRIGKKWLCACDCGQTKEINPSNLKRGFTKSCGCMNREMSAKRNAMLKQTHGMTNSVEYKTWQGMHQRCGNPKDKDYRHYGARGITVCERWGSFQNFYEDMGDKPDGLSIDRIDNDAGYSLDNCRWATPVTQANNKRHRNQWGRA